MVPKSRYWTNNANGEAIYRDQTGIQEKLKVKWGLGCFKVGAGTGVNNKC